MGLVAAMGDLQELFTHNFIIGLLSQGRTPPASPPPSLSLLERTRLLSAPRLLEEASQRGEDDPHLSPSVRAAQRKVPTLRMWTEHKRKRTRELCSSIAEVYSAANCQSARTER